VIGLLPNPSLDLVGCRAVAFDSVINPTEFVIDLAVFDELPLLLERSKVNVRRASILFMHQQ